MSERFFEDFGNEIKIQNSKFKIQKDDISIPVFFTFYFLLFHIIKMVFFIFYRTIHIVIVKKIDRRLIFGAQKN